MALENSSCPNDSNLRAVLEGTLSESEQAAVSRHLDRCQACQKRLEELAGLPGFRIDTANAPNPGPNSDLRGILARLRDDLDALNDDPSEACDEAILRLLSPSEEPSHLGRLGAYEILEVIGQGGMGIVFKGLDPRLNRFVAIKVLYPQLAANPIARRRFLREAQAAAAISHDHVVAIHAVEEASGFPLLVMEYVGGISLQERINRTGTLEVKEILRIGSQMAAGLAAAHNQGVIHRDIKPANILLENGIERVKITDFGLARAMDDVQLTQSGILAGTPQYMSPEQARGDPVDHRTDLFSLGAVMYAMCTGHSPFRAETALGSLRRVIEDTARPIQEVNSDIPDWLSEIVEILLAKVPAERLQSASDVAELLEQHLAHLQQPSAVPMPPRLRPGIEPPRHPLLRRRRWIFGGLGVLLLMFAGLGASEATGITKLHELVTTVIKVWTPQGTLIVEVADPQVKVSIDGEEGSVVVTGAGIHKLSLHPGDYQVQATKQGQAVCEDLVSVERNGQRVLRISLEPVPDLKITATEVAEAHEVLSKNPADPKANLVVGKQLGFMRGNWQEALPMLALGHDITLKRLALMELAGASTAEEQVTAGDAWWKLAQAGDPSAWQHIRIRAGYWYRKAFPELSGQRQVQVKARLKEIDGLSFSRFQAAAKDASITKTRVVGGGGGGPFEDIPEEPSLLVGFVVTTGHFGGHLVINSVQPIYFTSIGQKPSGAYGRQSTSELRVEAEDGYAVGGIIAQGGYRLDGFCAIFMRLEGQRLNPNDSYESVWLGGKDRVGGTVLGADGHPVIGIHGKHGAEVDCMGLVQAVIDSPG